MRETYKVMLGDKLLVKTQGKDGLEMARDFVKKYKEQRPDDKIDILCEYIQSQSPFCQENQ